MEQEAVSEELKPWFVTEPGGPMGRWPGVMEQGGRIIAFAVPDVTTAKELINLRAQLAERTTVVEQLQMALHLRDTQLTAMTTERDDYRSKSRALEHELELERGQTVLMTQRAEAAEAQVTKLTTMLAGQERLAQENTKEFDKVQSSAQHGVMVAAILYQQWQDADQWAKAAEARVKELEAQIAGMLPAAQPLVTSIEFLPLAMANPLAEMTKRAEAAEAALALATNSTPGKGTGVWVPLDKWTELQAQLNAVPVDALRRVLFTGYRTDAQIAADADAINNWLQSRE